MNSLYPGKVKEGILKIDGFIFLPGTASESGAVMEIFMMPMLSDAVGYVHSHPSFSTQPSEADLRFFSKRDYFHIIIAQPYNEESICAYDSYGKIVNYTIVQELSFFAKCKKNKKKIFYLRDSLPLHHVHLQLF